MAISKNKGGYTIIDLKGYDLSEPKTIKGISKKLLDTYGKEVRLLNLVSDDLYIDVVIANTRKINNDTFMLYFIGDKQIDENALYLYIQNDVVRCSYPD